MERALADAFRDGAARAVVIGADCPEITPQLLCDAFERLADADVVLGPTTDAGSTDATLDVAQEAGCRVLRCGRGRAGQMNAGAETARGGILLFLHPDSRLSAGFAGAVREALDRPGVAAGAFRLRIDGPERALRLMEWGVRVRSLRVP